MCVSMKARLLKVGPFPVRVGLVLRFVQQEPLLTPITFSSINLFDVCDYLEVREQLLGAGFLLCHISPRD